MIRRPPRSTPLYSSAASDVYKRQEFNTAITQDDLIDSTLDPEVGGTKKTFFMKDSNFLVGEKYALALKAFDEKQNQGKVSNIVQIYLPPATTTPTTPPSTTEDPTTTYPPTTTLQPTTPGTNTTPTTSDRSTVHPMTGCKDQTCASDGLFPGPEICSPDFCQCSWGVPHPKICQEGLVFNPSTGVCDWPWNNQDCTSTN